MDDGSDDNAIDAGDLGDYDPSDTYEAYMNA